MENKTPPRKNPTILIWTTVNSIALAVVSIAGFQTGRLESAVTKEARLQAVIAPVDAKLSKLEVISAEHAKLLAAGVPPFWFKDQVRDLQLKVDRIYENQSKIIEQLAEIRGAAKRDNPQ